MTDTTSFSTRVLAWYRLHGRKHLPWQQEVSAYKTWVSEIMLQQTQVATVIPYFNRFMARFPDVLTLANAEQDEVLAHWAGLGYYSRARNLHKSAQSLRDDFNGVFPTALDDVMRLSGIGKSTAGAILSLAYGQRHAILDGNVKRVLSRHQLISGIPNQSATLKKQWEIAEALTPQQECDKYTQAMMDLGAMVCTRTRPDCQACPVSVDCGAYQSDRIGEFPNKKPKKTLPEKTATLLIISDGQRLYLQKRPDKGIWGGLWSLPEVPEEEIATFLSNQGWQESAPRQVHPRYTHTFTHYRLHITPIAVTVENLPEGFRQSDLKTMGLPAPIAKILQSFF